MCTSSWGIALADLKLYVVKNWYFFPLSLNLIILTDTQLLKQRKASTPLSNLYIIFRNFLTALPPPPTNQTTMCTSSPSTVFVDRTGEKSPLTGGGVLSTGGLGKPPGEKCLDCDGYSCCCIPCVIM